MKALYPEFENYEYIPGEFLVEKRKAILPLLCEDYNIIPLPLKRNGGVLFGEQAVVGTLYLTNFRLFFKSVNKWQRITGKMSIFLSSIFEIENTSFLTSKEFVVTTNLVKTTFVILGPWGINLGFGKVKSFIEAINKRRLLYDNSDDPTIIKFLMDYEEAVYSPFKVDEKVNNFYTFMTKLFDPFFSSKTLVNEHLVLGNNNNEKCLGRKFLNDFKLKMII